MRAPTPRPAPLALCCVALTLFLAGLCNAATPTRTRARPTLVVISDSLSDNGNGTFKASGGFAPPASQYWQGRFSNGYVWNDYLLRAPFPNVINLAYGGAAVCQSTGGGGPPGGGPPGGGVPGNGTGPPAGGAAPLSLINQTAVYLSSVQPSLNANGTQRIVVVWGGGNDLMQGAAKTNGTARAAALANLTACYISVVRSLLAAGETRLIAGLPTIFGVGNQDNATRATSLEVMAGAAALIRPRLATVAREFPQARIVVWEVAAFVPELTIARPARYGFTNSTSPCLVSTGGPFGRRRLLSTPTPTQAALEVQLRTLLPRQQPVVGNITGSYCATPNTYIYWDNAHPTTAAHLVLARHFLLTAIKSRLVSI